MTPHNFKYDGVPGRLACGIALLIALSSCAGPIPAQSTANDPTALDQSYAAWARVLGRCSTPNGFRYQRLMEDRAELDEALQQISGVSAEIYQKLSRDQQLALLINAHNIHSVRQIVEHYPARTRRNRTWLRTPLKKRDIRLIGQWWSLQSLREEIMGPHFYEPRALFALNWGMKGCAPLPTMPATATNLDGLLEVQTREFARNPRYNRYSNEEKIVYASPLIGQYKRAIERDYTSLWGFFNHFSSAEDAERMKRLPPRILFNEFDKSLNDLLEVAQ